MAEQTTPHKYVCVYCSSSDAVDPQYLEAAEALGKAIVSRNCGLVYGGAKSGLMGMTARTVAGLGGAVVGVIPRRLAELGQGLPEITEYIITDDMRQRKAAMEDRADGFVALPGGFGTFEEILEIITLKQLGYHNKPIVLVNTGGFYDPLVAAFEQLYKLKFAKEATRELYTVTATPEEALEYIVNYVPGKIVSKWFNPDNPAEN